MSDFLVIFALFMAMANISIGFMVLTGVMKPNPVATALVWFSSAVYFLGMALNA